MAKRVRDLSGEETLCWEAALTASELPFYSYYTCEPEFFENSEEAFDFKQMKPNAVASFGLQL